MLNQPFNAGFEAVFNKLALAPTTPADAFVDGVEGAKDVPPDPSTLIPSEPPPMPQGPMPPTPVGSLGAEAAQAAG